MAVFKDGNLHKGFLKLQFLEMKITASIDTVAAVFSCDLTFAFCEIMVNMLILQCHSMLAMSTIIK